jgi:hypothetical protein
MPGFRCLSRRRFALLAAAGWFGLTAVALDAQRRDRRDETSWGAPIATNTLLANAATYDGKLVNLSVGVDAVLSRTAFIVDQRRVAQDGTVVATGQPVLVLFPYAEKSMQMQAYVLVRGDVISLTPEALERAAPGFVLDLAPEVVARHLGRPVIVANLVVDGTATVLGRKPIPPPTALDRSMAGAMTTIAPAVAALRSATQASGAPAAATSAARIEAAFGEVEALWEDVGQVPAAQWAREARDHATAIRLASSRGDWDAARASMARLNQLCGSCHAVYREQQEDGTFRLRPGSF